MPSKTSQYAHLAVGAAVGNFSWETSFGR